MTVVGVSFMVDCCAILHCELILRGTLSVGLLGIGSESPREYSQSSNLSRFEGSWITHIINSDFKPSWKHVYIYLWTLREMFYFSRPRAQPQTDKLPRISMLCWEHSFLGMLSLCVTCLIFSQWWHLTSPGPRLHFLSFDPSWLLDSKPWPED